MSSSQYLNAWDKAMHELEDKYHWLDDPHNYVSCKHESDKVIVFERAKLLFIFNFHWEKSFADYRVGTLWPGKYAILDTHPAHFGLGL